MSEVLSRSAIQLLPAQLADQIAAGEVIERPASVVKELLENALDAGSSRLDIELLAGGMSNIIVQDNGGGIMREELPLAISRHATSKITSLDDLLSLQTLGFRGEALASICSVSQWSISSRPAEQVQAGRLDFQSTAVSDVDHPVGTRVQIQNLFYNTPARKKFLRAERTEFRHCDDVIRRMALSRFDVGFYVKHNGRQCHRLPQVSDDISRSRRVAQLCGDAFIQQAMAIDYPRSDIRLWGWVSRPGYTRQQTDLQYFYINGRIIRDRMINHALRLAYDNLLPPGRHAAYVLHLELDPSVVDVNVHPTKHEVRFRQARVMHDFIVHSLRDALKQGNSGLAALAQTTPSTQQAVFHNEQLTEPHRPVYAPTQTEEDIPSPISQPNLLFERYVITQHGEQTFLIDVLMAQTKWRVQRWQQQFHAAKVVKKPLLIPARISVSAAQLSHFEQHTALFDRLGLVASIEDKQCLMLRYIPSVLDGYDNVAIFKKCLTLKIRDMDIAMLVDLLSSFTTKIEMGELTTLQDTVLANAADFSDTYRQLQLADIQQLLLS